MKFILLLLLPTVVCFAQPVISTVPDTLDFGIVTARDFLQGEVKVLNRGTDTLVLKSIETSCGCTAATPDASKIAFMETATMRVSVNIARHLGPFIQFVMIHSNDPKTPQKNVAVIAQIIPDTTKQPPDKR
ncbi:MAG TPA: DUF1573 domain-containing protein [Candidatus Kapabacteria bacterium]|nr:DUF1573 domain-containing protein [Candidatus Kapabacteria bacterium]